MELHIQNPYHILSHNMLLLELTYADDIVFFPFNQVLHEVPTTLRRHASKYNMLLNMPKTDLLHMSVSDPSPIFFFTPEAPNTKSVQVVHSARYLGTKVNDRGTLKSHIGPNLAATRNK